MWKRAALAKSVAFFCNATLARAFQAWAGYSADSQDKAARLSQAVSKWAQKSQTAFFNAWRDAVQQWRYGREVILGQACEP